MNVNFYSTFLNNNMVSSITVVLSLWSALEFTNCTSLIDNFSPFKSETTPVMNFKFVRIK